MDERYMRDMRGIDGRRMPPRNSRGEFMSRGRGRGRRGDRGMSYDDMRGDMRMRDGRVIRSYPRMDYGDDMRRGDMRGDCPMDGHYQHGRQSAYVPMEFMGYCQGYAGSPDHGDYRGGRDYGYDMRGGYGRRDYGYDYGYDDYGDYGETLSEKELEHWNKKLMEQLDEREKQMFHKDNIIQKFKQMGKPMEGFGENELYTATLMWYTDNKEFFGQNVDFAVKGGYAFLADKDTKVRGAEKLCVYFDEIVMGGEE